MLAHVLTEYVCIDWTVNWLDHSRTFREQGVEESETLLLRRKFFYSDQNVDSRDPVQLNLLYVQVKPVTHTHTVLSQKTPRSAESGPNRQLCEIFKTLFVMFFRRPRRLRDIVLLDSLS